MAQRIEIVRGTTNNIELTVTDADGILYQTATGDKIIFGVKKKPEDKERVITKTAEKVSAGVYSVALAPEDTASMNCGKYWFDVGLESGENFYNIIEPNLFVILHNITEKGCAE